MRSLGSVIVITHNSADCVGECLGNLAQSDRWRVLVIDNASTDASVAVARRVSAGVQVVCNERNLGFAAAVNQGVKAVEDEVIVVMNPDVVATPGALDALAEKLLVNGVGATGGTLTNREGQFQAGFTIRRFPDIVTALAEVLLVNKTWPQNPANRKYRCLDLDYSRTQKVQQPAGACLAFRRSAWECVGGWDEGFFPVWFEDVDFCRKLVDAGWEIIYCPEAVFIHGGGHSVDKLNFANRQVIWYRNLLRYFGKYHPTWQVALLRIGIIAGLALRCFLSLFPVRPARVSKWDAISGYIRAAWVCAVLNNDSATHVPSPGMAPFKQT